MARLEEIERAVEDYQDPFTPTYVSWLFQWSGISHYYGDAARQCLLAAAALMAVGAPFYSDDLAIEMPFIVLGTLVLVCIAALTSPWKQTIISAAAIASGVGLVIFEMWAFLGYSESTLIQFVLREAISLTFLFALYFSTKTLRAMITGRMGERDTALDFTQNRDVRVRSGLPLSPEEYAERRAAALSKMDKINNQIKQEYDD
jgi:hypothetical protein